MGLIPDTVRPLSEEVRGLKSQIFGLKEELSNVRVLAEQTIKYAGILLVLAFITTMCVLWRRRQAKPDVGSSG